MYTYQYRNDNTYDKRHTRAHVVAVIGRCHHENLCIVLRIVLQACKQCYININNSQCRL